jgi:hypothetical protein
MTRPIAPERGGGRAIGDETTGAALDAAALCSTLDLLEARALFDTPQPSVHVRIAEHGGRIYPDLADEGWRAVRNRTAASGGRRECCQFL